MELTRLKVNNQYCPCVDEMPYFSWIITSKKQNVMQKSYHVTVTGAEGLVWDSGVVESDASVFVEYKGKPFQSFSEHRVSGSLSLHSRGPFHLSFTVLCAIGH